MFFNSTFCRLFALPAAVLALAAGTAASQPFDSDRALQTSQSAIGNTVSDHAFLDTDAQRVKLSDYAGSPVLISLIYTSCHHTCPMVTQHLKDAVDHARERLGEDSFHVLTIGFDVNNDSPQAMKSFQRNQSVTDDNWDFLSTDKTTMEQLTRELGFLYKPSPRGFEHLVQLSILGGERRVVSQVYGARFDMPWLMEPMKRLVYGSQTEDEGLISGMVNRVKLFCTVYNPNTGRYMFDYSLFIQMAIGAVIILAGILFLFRERRRARQC